MSLTVTEFFPREGHCDGGDQIVILGKHFQPDAVARVTLNGVDAAAVVVVSSETITAKVPSCPPNYALPYAADVVVVQLSGIAHAPVAFTYTEGRSPLRFRSGALVVDAGRVVVFSINLLVVFSPDTYFAAGGARWKQQPWQEFERQQQETLRKKQQALTEVESDITHQSDRDKGARLARDADKTKAEIEALKKGIDSMKVNGPPLFVPQPIGFLRRVRNRLGISVGLKLTDTGNTTKNLLLGLSYKLVPEVDAVAGVGFGSRDSTTPARFKDSVFFGVTFDPALLVRLKGGAK